MHRTGGMFVANRLMRFLVLAAAVIIVVSPAFAQNSLECGQPTGSPAPDDGYFQPFENDWSGPNDAVVNYLNTTGTAAGLQETILTLLEDYDAPHDVQVM